MEVDSGAVEVYYKLILPLVIVMLIKEVVPEYKGTLTLKNSKVKVYYYLF